jgi:hypothetical protein
MKDCVALIGSTGFFEVFEVCNMSEQYSYWHFPVGTYHWSHSGEIHYLGHAIMLTVNGLRVTRDKRMRALVQTVEHT